MRRLFLILVGVVAALAVVAAIALARFDWSDTRPWIEKAASDTLGRAVTIRGTISPLLSLHPTLRAKNVHVSQSREKPDQTFAEFGSFDVYVWRFVDGHPIQNKWKSMKQLPATSKESDALSKDLKKRDMNFVGSTICYAFMQAVGMVNDHTTDCFRHGEV